MKKALICLVLLVGFNPTALTQNTYEFLRLDMSARAGALGGSFVSNADDPDVIFYNPAGISLLEENPVSFSFVKHLMDINLASLSFSTELENIGRVGAAVKYINYGTFESADDFGNRTGEYGAGEMAFILGYANSLDENFYYGANAKFIYSGIDEYSSTAVGLDVGVHYAIPSQGFNIGFSVLNIGTQLSNYISTSEDLPLDVSVGVSKKLEYLPVKLSLDFHKLNEDREDFVETFKAFTLGAEFNLSKVLTLRFGYDNEKRSELKIGSSAGVGGFNAGLGAKVSGYSFDYGYSSLGLVGGFHRITLSTNL